MPLDRSRLDKVRPTPDGGFTARCPACVAEDPKADHAGIHLRQFASGAFACAAHPGDQEHRRLVYAIAGDKSVSRALPATPRAFKMKRRLEARVTTDPERHSAQVLSKVWTPEEIRAASPSPIPENPTQQALAIVALFRPRDTVWTGDHYDSGKQRHRLHFRRAEQWIKGGVLAGPRICPAAFIPGVIVRAQRTVRHRRFVVIESDNLTKPEQGAVLRWLHRDCHLRLRAVIDTAGRSLHGWFDTPPARELELLRTVLPVHFADTALLNPAQPCRLPGWPREDTNAVPFLLYLDP